MGALTEPEIFSCLTENFRLAAQHCEDLAKLPRKGPTYKKLRDELKLIEGAARQAAYWRQDTRWLQIGMMMAEAHKRAGGWLRGIRSDNGMWRKLPPGVLHPYFMKLAENLRAGQKLAEQFRDARTGIIGTILPPAYSRPSVRKSNGGVILP